MTEAKATTPPRGAARRATRVAFVLLYLGFIALGFVWPWQPRAFWTVTLPLLVLFFVVAGFSVWRSVCPLAALGELGRRIAPRRQRRAPEWLERRYLLVSFVVLATMLALRLVATNGDGRWLSGLLVVLALAAMATNALWSGKSWCNFLCPVGAVERFYTDPSSLRKSANSQCARCTACKRSCPDIDQEASYWRELTRGGRRAATFAFPGLVLAFYGYFWLRYGDWEAYFDGRWTRLAASRALLLGPGFFFAPEVPAALAAPLTLAALSLASYWLFRGVEAALALRVPEAERRRHLALSLAAFAAFNLFYLFAGAPTLRRIPYGTRALAFVAPALATLVLARRWRRSHEAYVREKGAIKLLRNWPFDEPPPADPADAYALFQATERARDRVLAGYAQTVREIVADGVVLEDERRLFEELRRQFGITEREHERVLSRLARDERELLAGQSAAGAESRVQLEGYQSALTEALLSHASARELDELRRAFGVSPEQHTAVVEATKGGSGPLLARARRHLAELGAARADRLALEAGPSSAPADFLAYLLRHAEERRLERLLELLESVGEAAPAHELGDALRGADREPRESALAELRRACPKGAEVVDELGTILARAGDRAAAAELAPIVERLLAADDSYLRLGALWLGVETASAPARDEILARAAKDEDSLVRSSAGELAAARAAAGSAGASLFAARPRVERMQRLRAVPLFAELEPDDLEELSTLAVEETVAPPAALCEQGAVDSGDLFVLLDGVASVSVRGVGAQAGSEREVAELGANELVGELSLVDGRPRSATVRPKGGELRYLRIPGRAFRARLLHRERVARPLMLTLTQRLRRLSGRIAAAEQ